VDAVDILKICFRRWYVMLPILIGAAGVSYQLIETQETTYTAAASYGLVQPRLTSATGELERNPLGSDGSDLVGAALEAQLNSRVTQQQLGGESTRGWGPGESDNGSSYSVKIPMFETTYEVRAYGPDKQEVQDVVNRVIEAAPKIADELQTRAGAPTAVRYEPFVLAPTQVDALPATSALKLVIAVMGLGTLVGAAWSIVADRLLRRRRVGEDGAPHSGPAPSDEENDSLDPSTAARAARTATDGTPAGRTKNGQAGGVKPALKSGVKPGKSGKTAGSTGPGGGRRERRHQPLVRR
jgi:hypothetical protein